MAKSKQEGWYFNASKKDDKTATIVIEGTIGGYNWDADTWAEFIANRKNAFRKNLKKLINEGVNRIYVDIDSLGGLLNHGLVIHDLLAGFKGEVTTTTYGMTASAATIIAQSATKGKRRISANSFYLIHKAMVPAGYANSNELRQMLTVNEKMDETIKNIYKRNTNKKNAKKIDRLMEEQNGNGTWIDAYEAVGYGLADEVFEPKESAAVNWSKFSKMANDMKLPEFSQEFMNRVNNYSVSGKIEKPEPIKKSFWNMSFITDAIEAFKTKGWKLVDSENNEIAVGDAENGLTEEEITGITNSLVGDALNPLKAQIEALQKNAKKPKEEVKAEEKPKAKEEVETENKVDIQAAIAAGIAEALKAAGIGNKQEESEKEKLNKELETIQNKIKNLSKEKAKEKSDDISMQNVSDGSGVNLKQAAAAGGFKVKVDR